MGESGGRYMQIDLKGDEVAMKKRWPQNELAHISQLGFCWRK